MKNQVKLYRYQPDSETVLRKIVVEHYYTILNRNFELYINPDQWKQIHFTVMTGRPSYFEEEDTCREWKVKKVNNKILFVELKPDRVLPIEIIVSENYLSKLI